MNTYTSIDTILKATDKDNWSSRIIQSLIDTLSYDWSIRGTFWTPDNDIRKAVIASWNGKNMWVKLLWVKMAVLITQIDSLEWISSTQKERIRQLDRDFRQVFPYTSNTIIPYATKI